VSIQSGQGSHQALGETTIVVRATHRCGVLFSQDRSRFSVQLSCRFVCFDRGPEEEPRFEVNYHLFSTINYRRVRLKVILAEDDIHVPTVSDIWRTANWHERETYDLFGVLFDGHPDLRRILLPDDWQGHALRKGFSAARLRAVQFE